jgi:type IV fimbrial biogenesis protein FimT
VLSRIRQRGFSIIEIMVTVSIIGILMALAAPSAANWIQNTQLRNSADSVLRGIQMARLEALKRNMVIGFELQDANSTAWRVCIYDTVNNQCSTTQPDIHAKSASEGSPNARLATEIAPTPLTSALSPGDGMPAIVAFDAFGRFAPTAPNNFTRVDVRNPTMDPNFERRLVIVLAVGGQVRMCDPLLPKATNPQGCV